MKYLPTNSTSTPDPPVYANYIAYISGVLILLARLVRIIKEKTNLLYIFI